MKNILIICYLLISTLLMANEVTVSYPKNKTSYHLYKDLEEGRYLGSYVDLLEGINKDKAYDFRYKLDTKVSDEEIQIRKMGNFSTKYYYLETPYTQKVFIVGMNNINIDDLKNNKKLRLGCLGLGVDVVKNIQNSYEFSKTESVTFFRNEVDAYYALQNNKVDALLVLNFKQDNNFEGQILAVANIKEYIGVRKDRDDLFQKLKSELNLLSKNNQEILEINIKNRANYFKYIYDDLSNYEEIRKKYKTIKVLVPSKDFIPYYKKKLFKEIGIVPYLMENIEKFLDIPVEYVYSEEEEWDIEAVDFSRNNETMSREYFRTQIVAINHIYDSKITDYKQLDHLKIIKLQDMNLSTVLKKINYQELIEVKTLDEAFQLLKEDKGDLILGPYFLLSHYLYSNNYAEEFKISQSKFDLVAEMTFKDAELRDILNDILLSYSADEIEFISNKALLMDRPINIWLIITDILIVLFIIFMFKFIKTYIVKNKLKEFIKLFVRIEEINKLRDNRSLFHAKNVSLISRLIAQELGFRKSKTLKIEKLGLVHDIGLVFIPKEIILKKKTGVLSGKEEEIFREHTKMGDLLLKGIGIDRRKRKAVKYHHENLDGSGYLGLKGNDIPIESRILRVADMYDRIVSWNNNSHEAALEFLNKYKNIYFDPEIVEAIFKIKDEVKDIYQVEKQTVDIDVLLKEFEEILAK